MTTIKIRDLGCTETYHLYGSSYRHLNTGGTSDALHRAGIVLDERMDDAEIERRVWAGWTTGYDGDPAANELSVEIERE